MSDTPFNLVWNALWELAEANTTLMGYIRRGNRIDYLKTNSPKKEISDGDLPELELRSSGFDSNMMDTSNTSMVVRRYTWALATGSYTITEYNDISWELYKAMHGWDTTLCALEWPDDWHFVVRTNVMSAEEGTVMADENRGIMGWAGLFTLEVQMHFQLSDLRS